MGDSPDTPHQDLEVVKPRKRELTRFEKASDLRDFATRVWERDQEFLRVFKAIEQNSEDLQEELRILGFRLRHLKSSIDVTSDCEDLLESLEETIQYIDTLRLEQDYLISLSTARFETSAMFDLLSLLRASAGDWFPENPPSIRGKDLQSRLVLTCDRHWARILLDRIFHHINQDFTFSGELEIHVKLETPSTIHIAISAANARSLIRRGEEIPRLSMNLMRSIAQKMKGHFWIEKEQATEARQFESEEGFPDRTIEIRNFNKVSLCIILPGKSLS